MEELRVFLNYSLPDGVSETVLPLRILDADGGVVAETVASTSRPAIVPVANAEAPLFVRLTWPSGKTEIKRAQSSEVSFSDADFQRNEWSSWATLRVKELGKQEPYATSPSEGTIDRFDRTWLRLWQFSGGSWRVVPIVPKACNRHSMAFQIDFSLSESNWCLQIGGPIVPWRLVSLPGGECRVLITPNDSTDPRAELLKVAVTGFRTESETLLEFLSRDQLRAAHAIAKFEPLARSLLEAKFSDPISAVAGAYFLLRTEGWKSILPAWFDNLSHFSWIPDVFIIRCAVRVRSGLAEKKDVQEAFELFRQCFSYGLPVFAEGFALLRDVASVLRETSSSKRNNEFVMIKRLVVSQLWAGAVFSFSGTDPGFPDPKRRRGIPLEYRTRRRHSKSRDADRTILFLNTIAVEREVVVMPTRAKAPRRTARSTAKPRSPASKATANSAEKLKRITAAARDDLYSARQYLDSGTLDELTVNIPFDVYFQDPAVREATKAYNFDEAFTVPWEPGIADGPTSARFVVIDYDGTTESLNPPAKWDKKDNVFRDGNGTILNRSNVDTPQFHQVNVWATLQNALDFYESGAGLGRRIKWGFDGNRLIVVPHAGYGENAYYDRDSKSLQFYYFDHNGERVHTCLSADIINHEFGHAVLDGLRPLYRESVQVETAAFHEFFGDISAILIAFRNTKLRRQIGEVTGGDLDKDSALSSLAEQFGRKNEKPYLRTALNKLKYEEVKGSPSHHHMSQVMTGAMFDILRDVYRYNREKREHTVLQSLWFTASRMQNLAVQPLDLLPPVDVTFADYAEAVLRAEQIVNPTDPDDYRGMMLKAFGERGILSDARIRELQDEPAVLAAIEMKVFHEAGDIAASTANAYRFLDDNRRQLLIPYGADIVISDLSTAVKFTTRRRRQAKHILLQYVWREDVLLTGSQFGQFSGQTTDLLCGATLALDIDGNLLGWARKPGTLPLMRSIRAEDKKVDAEAEAGKHRRDAFLAALAARIRSGSIGGPPAAGAIGLLQKTIAPLNSYVVHGTLRFSLAPHVGIRSHTEDKDIEIGDRSWSISS